VAYLTIETSATRNKKFIKAGPAPSWLWVCGLAYCQEGLTDGFIPTEALPYLGVKNSGQLADHLVKAGLWHVADGGWQVNDYLEHNRSAYEVSVLKERRGKGGSLGGRPKKTLPETSKVSIPETLQKTSDETFPVDVDGDAVASVVVKEKENVIAFDGQAAFRKLCALYPAARVNDSQRVSVLFLDVLGHSDEWSANYALMMANLQTHIVSHEWSVKRYIPNLDKWLESGKWKRAMEPDAPPAAKTPTVLNADETRKRYLA
jgi:hypothetical protein